MLRDAADVLAPILTSLFNISIETKVFPSVWKDAIFKSADRKTPSNYRPNQSYLW